MRFGADHCQAALIEVQLARSKGIAVACKDAAISKRIDFRWRKESGGSQVEKAKRLKNLERENACLHRLLADLSRDKQILKDVARKYLYPEQRRQVVSRIRQKYGLSERHACRLAATDRLEGGAVSSAADLAP